MIIENDEQYRGSLLYLTEGKKQIEDQREKLQSLGYLTPEQVQKCMDPLESFFLGVEGDIEVYEAKRNGK